MFLNHHPPIPSHTHWHQPYLEQHQPLPTNPFLTIPTLKIYPLKSQIDFYNFKSHHLIHIIPRIYESVGKISTWAQVSGSLFTSQTETGIPKFQGETGTTRKLGKIFWGISDRLSTNGTRRKHSGLTWDLCYTCEKQQVTEGSRRIPSPDIYHFSFGGEDTGWKNQPLYT